MIQGIELAGSKGTPLLVFDRETQDDPLLLWGKPPGLAVGGAASGSASRHGRPGIDKEFLISFVHTHLLVSETGWAAGAAPPLGNASQEVRAIQLESGSALS
jgi:hypothetical protein